MNPLRKGAHALVRLLASRKAPKVRGRTRLALERLESRFAPAALADAAFGAVLARTSEALDDFYVYRNADSSANHGFPSGKFASNNDLSLINALDVDPAAINDPTSATGTTTNANALDRSLGTVLRIRFPALTGSQFVGLALEEPEFHSARPNGRGYNLNGATHVTFVARSPTPGGLRVQFGVGGKVTDFNAPFVIGPAFQTISIPLSTLRDPNGNAVSPPDLSDVHFLFSVSTNASNAPSGGILLIDDVRFAPTPANAVPAFSLPRSVSTFGVVPATATPFALDQVLPNLSTVYESSLAGLALLRRGDGPSLAAARRIAEAFVYALRNDNAGVPLAVAPDGSHGLHDGYSAGDLVLLNDQDAMTNKLGKRGQVRLAGFSADPQFGSANGFYLVQDGATGGNNAFAAMFLADAFTRLRDVRYLDAAREIGNWIVGNLLDTTGTGFGGYYFGYERDIDTGVIVFRQGKSIENNADVFSAFMRLSLIARQMGDVSQAALWEMRAKIAGDFVLALYDAGDPSNPNDGHFSAGTVPVGTRSGPGIDPSGAQRGNDVINRFLILDSATFSILALAGSPLYRNAIDWREPVRHLLQTFAKAAFATANGQRLGYSGFSLVTQPTATPISRVTTPGADGIAWEFTGQTVATMLYVDRLYASTEFAQASAVYVGQLRQAQTSAPFTDGASLPAATLQNENADSGGFAPRDQGLTTPFQVIPERGTLAATLWAIFADLDQNVFLPLEPIRNDRVVYGAAGGSSLVSVRDARSGLELSRFEAFPGFSGGVSVAVGDVNGDGTPDVVVGAGGGGRAHVKVFDGTSGALTASFFSFDNFDGPVTVAAGDVTGDGRADVVVGAPINGHVRVFDLATGQIIRSFLAFENFAGSVSVAVGDLNGDGRDDLIIGASAQGHVKAFDAVSNALVQSFLAYVNFNSSVSVAAGDVDGDGFAEIITGAGSAAAHVKVFDGRTNALEASFIAFPGGAFGVRVGAADVDGDGKADVLSAPAATAPHVRVFKGPGVQEIGSFLVFEGNVALSLGGSH